MAKKRVAVLFGGASKEYEVSLHSAYDVITGLPADKYEVVPIGITKAARWLFYPGSPEKILSGEWDADTDCCSAILSPDPMHKGFLKNDSDMLTIQRVDAVFSVLHGKYGDCGHIHGLCKLSGVPYVGSDYASAAMCSDKILTSLILGNAGVKVPRYTTMERVHLDALDEHIEEIEKVIGYPCHVKSANCSPSFGSNYAGDRETMVKSVKTAFSHHRKIIIEENIEGRFFECAVYGSLYNLHATSPAEHAEVKKCECEFVRKVSTPDFSPELPYGIAEQMRSTAKFAFLTMGCKDYAKVRFVLSDGGVLYCMRVHAMCGFHKGNMLPRLIMSDGFTYEKMLEYLIDNA